MCGKVQGRGIFIQRTGHKFSFKLSYVLLLQASKHMYVFLCTLVSLVLQVEWD